MHAALQPLPPGAGALPEGPGVPLRLSQAFHFSANPDAPLGSCDSELRRRTRLPQVTRALGFIA